MSIGNIQGASGSQGSQQAQGANQTARLSEFAKTEGRGFSRGTLAQDPRGGSAVQFIAKGLKSLAQSGLKSIIGGALGQLGIADKLGGGVIGRVIEGGVGISAGLIKLGAAAAFTIASPPVLAVAAGVDAFSAAVSALDVRNKA